MLDSFLEYAEWVALETFFSGYLFVYAIVYLIGSNRPSNHFVKNKVLPKLPLAYALVGTLYWGMQIKNAYPDYDFSHLLTGAQLSYLRIWGLLSILFWIPILRKKAVLSLLHSLVFFFLLMKSVYLQFSLPADSNDSVRNNMKIYSFSILLNAIALIVVTVIPLLIARFRNQK